MAKCARCGRELPAFSIGELSDTCSDCRKADQAGSVDGTGPYVAKRNSRSLLALTPATTAIIAINAVVLAAMTIREGVGALSNPPTETLVRWGADWGILTLSTQPWRAFTSIWLHVGALHLLLNMWCLNIYGRVTERLFGWRFYLLMYAFAGLCGSLASLGWRPDRVSAGASGAIFGVAGALVMPYRSGALSADAAVLKRASKSLLTFIGFNLFIGFVVPVIDNSAHLGGLLGGFAMGMLWTRYRHALDRGLLQRIAIVCAVFVGVTFATVRYVHRWDVLVSQASEALEAGHYDEAIAKAKTAIAHAPDDASAYAVLGSAYVAKDQPKEAAEALEPAVRLDPKDEFALRRLGVAYLRLERFEDARRILEQAVALNEKDYYAQAELGVAYRNLKRDSEALTHLQRAIQLNPDFAYGHYVLGLIRESQKQDQLALESFRQAVNLEPRDADYAGHLADSYDARGQHKEAEDVRHKAGLTK
jgi:membrane associated rhomboid family serine protease/Flp pilus assembly protein TadD